MWSKHLPVTTYASLQLSRLIKCISVQFWMLNPDEKRHRQAQSNVTLLDQLANTRDHQYCARNCVNSYSAKQLRWCWCVRWIKPEDFANCYLIPFQPNWSVYTTHLRSSEKIEILADLQSISQLYKHADVPYDLCHHAQSQINYTTTNNV